ncbi:MAG: hypothetical protein CMJ78_25770 [Planctomycetaceae bacterium]|nr:hypothetical protein [Planctomycetaceae bacterium]
MSTELALRPIRVSVVGDSPAAVYQLERLCLHEELVAHRVFCGADANLPRAIDCQSVSDWDEVLTDAESELVFFAWSPDRTQKVIEALSARKHVLLEGPIAATVEEAQSLIQGSENCGRLLDVVDSSFDDDDFQTALDVARTSAIGKLEAIHFCLWEMAIPTNGQVDVLWTFGLRITDQLLQLADQPIETVTARKYLGGDEIIGFHAIIDFDGGLRATLDVHLDSHVPLHSGWSLNGTEGGYRDFSKYTRTDDGEIYATRLTPTSIDPDHQLLAIYDHLRKGQVFESNCQRAKAVVELIDRIRNAND